jgi:hypothetical protein
MIWESCPWRQALLRDAETLRRWGRKNPSDRRAFLIEQKVFNGAYGIRKLYQAKKLSSSFEDLSIKCLIYPCRVKKISLKDAHKWYDHYDFETSHPDTVRAQRLTDMIIHSFTFVEQIDNDGYVEALLITSDRLRYKGLWQIELSDLVTLMRSVGVDSPSSCHAVLDRESGEWFEWRGHGEPPSHIGEKLEELTATWRRS